MVKKRYYFSFIDSKSDRKYYGFIIARNYKQAKRIFNNIIDKPLIPILYFMNYSTNGYNIGYVYLNEF